MNEMPENIKQDLRNLASLYVKVQLLENKIENCFQKYGIDVDDLRSVGTGEVQTEAFAFIANCKGDIEKNILDIEKVFLYYANKRRNESV